MSAIPEKNMSWESAFEKYVIQKAQEELADTDMSFNYELKKEGRSYKWIVFNFTKGFQKKADASQEAEVSEPVVSPKKTAKEAFLHPEEQPAQGKRLVYDRMVGDYNLSPRQVSLIFKNFSLAEINQSLYQIQLKIADGKVQNKANYTAKWFQNQKPSINLLNSDLLI